LDCELIQESRNLLNELLSRCQDDFEKKKEQENQILKNLEVYEKEFENLFESLMKLKEDKLKEIEELKLCKEIFEFN
jgi:adenylate kinase family enzyme